MPEPSLVSIIETFILEFFLGGAKCIEYVKSDVFLNLIIHIYESFENNLNDIHCHVCPPKY